MATPVSPFQTPPTFPGATAAPAAPTAAPAAPAAAAAPAEVAPKTKAARSEKIITPEDTKFVITNVKTMSYVDMAAARGLSKNQVNRILQELKVGLRTSAINEAAPNDAYARKGTNKSGGISWDWSQPLTEKAKKVEAKIESSLNRPAETRPGGAKGGGKVAAALKSEIADLLKDL